MNRIKHDQKIASRLIRSHFLAKISVKSFSIVLEVKQEDKRLSHKIKFYTKQSEK